MCSILRDTHCNKCEHINIMRFRDPLRETYFSDLDWQEIQTNNIYKKVTKVTKVKDGEGQGGAR